MTIHVFPFFELNYISGRQVLAEKEPQNLKKMI